MSAAPAKPVVVAVPVHQVTDPRALVELDENRLKLYINELFDGPSDVVNRRTLKPLIEAYILRDTVHAF